MEKYTPLVGGGESNLGDELEENFHFSFCFLIAAFLPSVVLTKWVSISTSSKVRRELMSARASMAIVTLPRATIWARCFRAGEVLEGSMTVMALELQQKLEESVR